MVDASIKRYIIIGSIIAIVVAVVFSVGFPQLSSVPLIVAPVLLTVVSILMYKVLANPKFVLLAKFSTAFMATNMIKMIINMIYFVVSYICLDQSKKFAFAIAFVSLYIVYLVIDTVTLLNLFRDKDKS